MERKVQAEGPRGVTTRHLPTMPTLADLGIIDDTPETFEAWAAALAASGVEFELTCDPSSARRIDDGSPRASDQIFTCEVTRSVIQGSVCEMWTTEGVGASAFRALRRAVRTMVYGFGSIEVDVWMDGNPFMATEREGA